MQNEVCENYHKGFELHTICGHPSKLIMYIYNNYCSDTVQETFCDVLPKPGNITKNYRNLLASGS